MPQLNPFIGSLQKGLSLVKREAPQMQDTNPQSFQPTQDPLSGTLPQLAKLEPPKKDQKVVKYISRLGENLSSNR